MASNIVPCGGHDNENEGCQEIFLRGTGGLCQKCKKLSKIGLSDEDINLILKVRSLRGHRCTQSTSPPFPEIPTVHVLWHYGSTHQQPMWDLQTCL
jgi:hypothetical protein